MVKKPHLVHPAFLHTRTRLQAGNPASDQCYAERNAVSVVCALSGWPQETHHCRGNNNEIWLMECLQKSGETNWWKDFANCTSAEQCINLAYEKNFK